MTDGEEQQKKKKVPNAKKAEREADQKRNPLSERG